MSYREPPRLGPLQDYAIEWRLENSDRYSRLANVRLKEHAREGYNSLGRLSKDTVTDQLIIVVLQVPRVLADNVTTMLRNSPVNSTAEYLKHTTAHADKAHDCNIEQAKLQRTIQQLQKLVIDKACLLDTYDKAIARGEELMDDNLFGRMGLLRPSTLADGRRHETKVLEEIKAIDAGSFKQLEDIRAAIDEKKTEVAAKLLSKLPDGDF